MYGFLRKHRIGLSCGFFLLLSLLLATVNAKAPYRVDPVGVLLLEVMLPLQFGATVISQEAERLWDHYFALWSLRQTNETLHQRVETLENLARRAVELELTNQRLRRLLELREDLRAPAVAARVVGRSPTAWIKTIVLDRGKQHGITKGMAVLTPEGVVGQVVSVSAHAARVLLVSDPNSGVDALIQRTRARGIVAGTIEGQCILKYIQRQDDVRTGDRVVTSGLDGIFPKGQPIGGVVRVGTKDNGLFQDVEVRLSAELTKVEEVLVVASGALRAGE
jgi:rod shape-determining protein MreC